MLLDSIHIFSWTGVNWKCGRSCFAQLVSFLCWNISLDLFYKSQKFGVSWLLYNTFTLSSKHSEDYTATWVLWLGNWWFLNSYLYQRSCKAGENWPLFVFYAWSLSFYWCNSSWKLLLTHLLICGWSLNYHAYLSFFWSGNVSETFLRHFLMKISYSLQKTTLCMWPVCENWKVEKTAFWCKIRLPHMKLPILRGKNDWKSEKKSRENGK